MTSVVCSPTPHFTNSYMDRYTRDSNSAGAPLPRIPRRTPPVSRATSSAPTLKNLFAPLSPAFIVHPPTPPSMSVRPPSIEQTTVEESSSSSSESYVEVFSTKPRIRVSRKQLGVCPPEHSTPTPAVFKAQTKAHMERVVWPSQGPSPTQSAGEEDTPRPSFARPGSKNTSNLRLNLDGLDVPTIGSSTSALTVSGATPSSRSTSASLGRKKSGEPLKSSLKGRRPLIRGDLSVVTGTLSSKSEPNTPTHIKSVHFDTQLERVKLFLAEQKPLAVSRDGSPTDDTSGTESDFPSFIYGESEDERTRRCLSIDLVNMPSKISESADVALESLILSSDGGNINGRVRVRNLAFEKWIAIRFTFDWWQTTSEVTARYIESLPGGTSDRFGFTIRLNDMLKRIEEKTMFLAIRYSVSGKEIWDNNKGDNYQVRFKKQTPTAKLSASSESKLAALNNKLEEVAKDRETVGGMFTSQSRGQPASSPATADSFSLKSNMPLSARYDFSASLKSPWKAESPFLPEERSRTSTYPNSLPKFPRRSPVDKKTVVSDPQLMTRGSPRIADAGDNDSPSTSFYVNPDLEDTPVPIMSRRSRARNHQRGYFDLGIAQSCSVRRTPPGTPQSEGSTSIMRFNSFPPTSADSTAYRSSNVGVSPSHQETNQSHAWHVRAGGSEESTPSVTNTSESSQSSSPAESPLEGPTMYAGSPVESNYDVFLNRFCFFTGSDSLLDVPVDSIHRSHSASSVEELLSSPNPSGNYHVSLSPTPTRSSSFDDVACMSGTSTPTAHSIFGSSCPTPTPVAFVH